jgi:acyl-CoA thioesterase
MRRDSFISPELNTIQKLENSHLTRSLALFLQNIDKKEGVIYGVEIKSNGSERSSRIPLVRFSDESVSIWKIASNIESVEKKVV